MVKSIVLHVNHAEEKEDEFLMGELSKKKHNTSTTVRVSLDADLMRANVDAEESQVAFSSGEKKLAYKTCGKIDRILCIPYNLFYYIGRRALTNVNNQGEEVMDTREGQSLSIPVCIRECIRAVQTCKGLPMLIESNGKVLTEEAMMHITSTTVKYSYTDHPIIASYSCRAKSWELIYN